ncbi:MAG: D-alanyl-D-alanine carboxypeptidase [Oscillospiraceae bacterium]|jgi:D-alanyl-D-alanine carboxypeptidase/D-alanyl-D-alanine carboxypeptidase (penicillin-binding protein 5/6)|nr:D-alanyl-D-alanine carboxypeptidase [Oscillospiraceae bacterium]
MSRKKVIKKAAALLLALCAVYACVLWLSPSVSAQEPPAPEKTDPLALSARHAVLLDAETMQVIYAKDCDTQAAVASTTKIMTALLLLEAGEPAFTFVATDAMVRVEGTSMGLRGGDAVSRYALACGMLMSSGNDAANAAAIHLAGSLPAFADLMNRRAAEIGMTRTHFVTPSGLDAEGHVSTAYDMALLGLEALRNPVFREICAQAAIRVSYGNPPYPRTLRNHNRLVRELPGCVGIKTGFTEKAGRTLVSAVERDGRLLVAVTLRASNDWEDHRKLYDYGFAQYHPITLDDAALPVARMPVAGGSPSAARVMLYEAPVAYVRVMPFHIRRELLLRPFEYAPLPAGKVVGVARYYAGDILLAEAPLVLQSAVEPARPRQARAKQGVWGKIRQFFRR